MAPVTPPSYLQAGSFSARSDRLALAGLLVTDYAVGALAARAGVKPAPSGSGMSVVQRSTPDRWATVNAGTIYIPATSATGGVYVCHNDAAYDVQTTSPHASLSRKDLIVARVYDAVDDVGVLNDFKIEVVTGTPAASPAQPTLPSQSVRLAEILVAPGSVVTTASITDLRVRSVAVGGVLPVPNSGGLPASPPPGMPVWREDQEILYLRGAAAWRPVAMSGPMARLYASAANTNLARGVNDKVLLNTASVDTDTGLNAANNRYVFPKVGWWQVSYGVQASTFAGATGQPAYVESWLSLNGNATNKWGSDSTPVTDNGQVLRLTGTDLIQVTSTSDYVELFTKYTSATVGANYNQAIISTVLPYLTAEWRRA